ncbi:maleylacetoacetate isomerase [Sphingomonas flavalba]|uniref:maleylacetoacetate isomerase n=1 Tax=Sphingomonas flavalba TaxID=2559804 RepID=UPI0039E0659C
MSVTLFDYWRSSASYRVRIALNLKGIAYTSVAVPLLADAQRAPDNLARNRQGMVPTLAIDGLELTQSLAIIAYLDRRAPEPPLFPADPARHARAMAMALVVACDIHPLDNLRVLRYLDRELGVEQAARDGWYRHWIDEGFTALEAMAGDAGAGPFLGGTAPDIADICLVPQMYNARRLAVDLAPYPALVAADAAAQALPAFAAAHPDRVKPADA